MADRFRTMAFSIVTERLTLKLRTEEDAECNLELLQEHEGGTILSLDEVAQRMVERSVQAQVDGFGVLGIRRLDEEGPIGFCGLIIGRASFDEPEIAYETPQRPRALSSKLPSQRVEIACGRRSVVGTQLPSEFWKRTALEHIMTTLVKTANLSGWFGTLQRELTV
jgi:hypothetical protein